MSQSGRIVNFLTGLSKGLLHLVLLFCAAQALALPNDIVFVTQPPLPQDFATVNATFGNHRAELWAIPRGGDLYIRYADGTLKNLTQTAGYGESGMQGSGSIAVRDPAVSWDAKKVLFSMVIGAPTQRYQVRQYFWQIYEITGLGKNETPVITKVPNQPANYNNVMPIYGTNGRIIFVSDRPRNNQSHFYPQLDEYESTPTNSGLWSFDPTNGDIFLLDHAPSGDFHPLIDSFGRVIFTRWDHLQRDQQNLPQYAPFNYSSEESNAAVTTNNSEVFPEPRSLNDPDYQARVNLFTINNFFPWMISENGMGMETLNHIGRQELISYIERSFNDDPSLKEFFGQYARFNDKSLENMFQIKEDPTFAGRYVAVNAPEFQTHASGQIISLDAPPTLPADQISVKYLTHRDTSFADDTPSANHSGLYRDPLPLSDGTLLAVHTAQTRGDANEGTTSAPQSRYDFRLKLLQKSGEYYAGGQLLTPGVRKTISYWNPDELVTYDNQLFWELQPVELRPRNKPLAAAEELAAPEQEIFTQTGVDVAQLTAYLKANDLALIISRDTTARDELDLQQPFNLRVAGTNKQSIKNNGKVYDISHLQVFEGQLIRSYQQFGQPRVGRRVLAQPVAAAALYNPTEEGGAPGTFRIGSDGSVAAFVPARKALTWQTIAPDGAPVVRERFWVTFQPGEIRVCASCHGLNSKDQLARTSPSNPPLALASLLNWWKNAEPDSDGDGLFDGEERTRGTDPNNRDTDGDGVGDAKEVRDGTNPLDRGSNFRPVPATVCAEWNGFLGGMWNIMEHVNLGSEQLRLSSTLYSINGVAQQTLNSSVLPGAQRDLLVHDISGWERDSYGKVCTAASASIKAALDGRMVYYKQRNGRFDFAFALPFGEGVTGRQVVQYNTFQPSLNWQDQRNAVANWIQLTNVEDAAQSGQLVFYDIDGQVVGRQEVYIEAGARRDFSGHQFGPNKVGVIEWIPSEESKRLQMRNVRYYYDNAELRETFAAAFQLEGRVGSGEVLLAPLLTENASAVVEISNTLGVSVATQVQIYNVEGQLKQSLSLNLGPYASQHIITDQILNGESGVVTVDGSERESIVATVMQYGRTADAGIEYIYGVQAKEALGSVLRGSYNTFLGQSNVLLLLNSGAEPLRVFLDMTRQDSSARLSGEEIVLPAKGMVQHVLDEHEEANQYGTIALRPARGNSLVAHLIRQAPDEQYRFPTEVR